MNEIDKSYLEKIEEHLDKLLEVMKRVPTLNFDTILRIEKGIEDLKLEAKYAKSDDLPGIFQQLNVQHDLLAKFSKPVILPKEDSPFFGHMLIEQNGKKKDIYLGHVAFTNDKLNFKIIDWKNAPLAKVYYQYDEGDDFDFDLDERSIEGNILEKSVVSIVDGKLYQIQRDGSSSYLRDGQWVSAATEVQRLSGGQGKAFGELGSGKTDFKSPDVISMFDKEQFELVNRGVDEPLVIIGGAGSGKTTVALYRLAMMCEKKLAYQNEVIVLVPNEGLVRLSKALLDKIGLEKVQVKSTESVFNQLAFQNIKGIPRNIHKEAPLSSSIIKRSDVLLDILRESVSEQRKEAQDRLLKIDVAKRLSNRPLLVALKEILVQEKLNSFQKVQVERMISDYSNFRDDLFHILSDDRNKEKLLNRSNGRFNSRMIHELSEHVKRQIQSFDDDSTYYDREVNKDNKVKGIIDQEDIPLLLKLLELKIGKCFLPGKGPRPYKHIFLDEAQELCPVELNVISNLLHDEGNVTIAGDAVQQIDPTMNFESWNKILEHLGVAQVEVKELNVSYRSPKEIIDFAHYVLGPLAPKTKPTTSKSGGPILRTQVQNEGHATMVLMEALEDLLVRETKASVAIICNKMETARSYYEELRELPQVRLVEHADFNFNPGVDITTVDQIRGLEFDYVIIPDANQSDYPDGPRSRKRMHLASTRAIHQLWVMYTSQRSVVIPGE